MMSKKLLTFLLISSVLVVPILAQKKNIIPEKDEPQPFGLNMAGADFGKNFPGVFNKDYTYPTPANLDYMVSKGFKLMRLPFKWDRIQHNLFGELNKEELARLKGVVDEAAKRDILVLFDLHNYGRRYLGEERFRIGEGGLEIEHLADLWSKIADLFKDYNNIWGYGLMNEPNNMLDSTPWAKIAQACISAIRKIDTKNTIVVGGDSWSSAERWYEYSDDLKNLYDPSHNLIFEAHVYFDDDASGTYKKSYDEENANPYKGIERIQPFIKWLSENNARGFIGEYGIPDKDERWQVCLDNFLKYLQEKNINGTYWAAGPWWGTSFMAIQPIKGVERPQMKVVEKYLWTE